MGATECFRPGVEGGGKQEDGLKVCLEPQMPCSAHVAGGLHLLLGFLQAALGQLGRGEPEEAPTVLRTGGFRDTLSWLASG